jgi:hypothetical protein
MNLQEDIQILTSNGYSLERIAVVCKVTSMTVYRWWKKGDLPNKLVRETVHRLANKYRIKRQETPDASA